MKNIKRILFYDSDALTIIKDPLHPSGGAAKQVLAWRKGLLKKGHKVQIMGAHIKPEIYNEDEDLIVSYNSNKGVKILRYLYYRIPLLLYRFYKSDAEYVYCGVPGHMTGLIALVCFLTRKKFVLRVSSNRFTEKEYIKKQDRFRYVFFLLSFKLTKIILCQNNYQYNNLTLYHEKTHLITNPFINDIELNINSHKCDDYVCWIANFRYVKNIPLLLRIAEMTPKVKFKVAGSKLAKLDDKSRLALNQLYNLPNVEILGYLKSEDILELLKNSLLLLNTSYYEGFSNTYLEAFSVGTPVCTLENNDPNNIVRDHELGIIYSDEYDFKVKYEHYINSKHNKKRITHNCFRYMRDNHDLSQQTKKFVNILDSIK